VSSWRDVLVDKYSSTRDGRRQTEVKFFTDNIVFGLPLRSDSINAELSSTIGSLGLLQVDAVRSGLFLRGGLACGDNYMNDHIAFGVALLDAHEAESCVARWPRVVLAKSTRNFIAERSSPREDVKNSSDYCDYLIDDSDGECFVNYLEACFHDNTEPPEFSWTSAHRDMVKRRIAEHCDDAKILAKYEWVARYHNYWCDSWRIRDYRIEGYDSLQARRPTFGELAG
jgi:hypothetical protein